METPNVSIASSSKYEYYYMYKNCSSLNEIKVNFSAWGSNSSTGWFDGIYNTSPSGYFICPIGLSIARNKDKIPTNWTVLYEDDNKELPLTLIAEEAGSTVSLSGIGNPTKSGLKYRTNSNTSWTSYPFENDSGLEVTLTNKNDWVQFKNTENTLSTSSSNYIKFIMSGKIIAKGNCNSLINYQNVNQGCFYSLFINCSSLLEPPELPSLNIAVNSYCCMFTGCSNLRRVPKLPGTSVSTGSYQQMFQRLHIINGST